MEITEFHSNGAFGKIYLAKKSNGFVIIKHIKCTPGRKIELPREAVILKKLNHPNIIKIFFVKRAQNGDFLLGLEYYNNLSLEDCIILGESFNKDRIMTIFCQMVSVIKYLHSMNIVHGDIKTDNILINIDNKIKFCDFGFSRYSNGKCSIKVGSLNYFPPEVLLSDFYDPFKADIWCAGIVLYTLNYGSCPDRRSDLSVILKQGEDNEFDIFIMKMLEYEPSKRWDITEIDKRLHK